MKSTCPAFSHHAAADGRWWIQPRADKPSVLFILADDLDWGDLAYGHPQIQTPHLDQLMGKDSFHPVLLERFEHS
jgi:hypothetical protein